MAERWSVLDAQGRSWTPTESAERDRIIGVLAEALTLPARQVNYSRVAELLGIPRGTVISKLLDYGIPCPALVRVLTPGERERIAEIRKTCNDDREQLRMAVSAFIRDVWNL